MKLTKYKPYLTFCYVSCIEVCTRYVLYCTVHTVHTVRYGKVCTLAGVHTPGMYVV